MSVAIMVGVVAVARQIAPRSASSATCWTTSSGTTPNRLSPMRPQKGTLSGHCLSPARLPDASPKGL